MSISGYVLGRCWVLGQRKKSHQEIVMKINLSQELSLYPDQFVQTSTVAVSRTVESCQFVIVAGDSWQLNLV